MPESIAKFFYNFICGLCGFCVKTAIQHSKEIGTGSTAL
jgi:hypothetical protein